MSQIIETSYPITFRQKQAEALGNHLRHHSSVVIVGMKRVGISNFLRFFLNHPDIEKTYIHTDIPHIFIQIDLNDLVERDIYPFWTLTLKRLVDTIDERPLPETVKKQSKRYFSESIQLHDVFFTVDSVQKVLKLLEANNFYPTLFFIRFDRMKDAITPEFFSNLQGLKDAVHQKLSYVFTSYRPLSELSPTVFTKSSLQVFSQNLSLPPAQTVDMISIVQTLEDRYKIRLPEKTRLELLQITAGHVQYAHLALMKLHREQSIPDTSEALTTILLADEDIMLQSEELFESLTKTEQEVILAIAKQKPFNAETQTKTKYLWDTGILLDTAEKSTIFSPLLAEYVKKYSTAKNGTGDFTKKEHLLFCFLQEHENAVCERGDIIETVWPEMQELGVTDWAIDRLIARVRAKMKVQQLPFEIITVITRGYKLMKRIRN